jgi:predicted nucleic acid-binding protein
MATDLGGSYVLVDTSAYINLTRGRARSQHLIPHVDGKRLVMSFVTVAELRRGAYARGYNAESWRQLDADVSAVIVVPPDDDLSHEWARLTHEARQLGHALGQKAQAHDAWIAATARLHGLAVLTEDGGFDDFPGLWLLPARSPSSE